MFAFSVRILQDVSASIVHYVTYLVHYVEYKLSSV